MNGILIHSVTIRLETILDWAKLDHQGRSSSKTKGLRRQRLMSPAASLRAFRRSAGDWRFADYDITKDGEQFLVLRAVDDARAP